jgi:pSer/pThr/pTyr-binding forkhead associated (FHA) protein
MEPASRLPSLRITPSSWPADVSVLRRIVGSRARPRIVGGHLDNPCAVPYCPGNRLGGARIPRSIASPQYRLVQSYTPVLRGGSNRILTGQYQEFPSISFEGEIHMTTTANHTTLQASLCMMSGAHPGDTIDLPVGETVIGRSEDCAPLLRTDQSLSRRHAKLRHDPPGTITVEDLGSLNGTQLNGSPVTSPMSMRPGDTLTVGGSTLRLQVSTPEPATAFIPKTSGNTARDAQESPAALLQQARALLNAGDLTGSKALFQRLLQHPEHAGAGLYGIGYIQLQSGALRAAEKSFQECLRLDPKHADALFQLGFIAERQGSPATASERYQQAISVNPQHKGALIRLRALAAANRVTPSQASLQEHGSPEEAVPDNVDDYGVYEFLKRDNSIVSRQAIAIIDDLAIEAKPPFIAYAGAYLWRILIALVIGLAIFQMYFVFVGPVLLLLFYLYVLSVRIRLHRGRLQIERGLLRRRLKNYDIWRIRNVDLDRRLLNRFTGDGMLIFDLTPYSSGAQTRRARRGNTVRVIGLARGQRLIEVHQKLLNLEFLLRGNPVVKGIIQ